MRRDLPLRNPGTAPPGRAATGVFHAGARNDTVARRTAGP